MNEPKHIVGWNIREIRKQRKLTQVQLAKLLQVSPNTLSRWETGIYNISIKDLVNLEYTLKVTSGDLLNNVKPNLDIGIELAELENEVYNASISFYERGEHRKIIIGNGHHMAQELSKMASDLYSKQMNTKKNDWKGIND